MTTNNTAEGQEVLRKFVEREVFCCVSSFMYAVGSRLEDACGIFDEDFEETFKLFSQEDWEGAARDAGWVGEEGTVTKPGKEGEEDVVVDSWREACEIDRLEPYLTEALEHWIVSSWLAKKLEDKGEMTGEFAGLTIWGRACSGQSTYMDGVICGIYNEMMGSK